MLINKRSFSQKKEKDEIKNETKLMQQKISFIIGKLTKKTLIQTP